VDGWWLKDARFVISVFRLTITGTIHLWLTSIDKQTVGRSSEQSIKVNSTAAQRQLWRGFFRLQQHFNH
jgi:protein-S-isoprenylcysteine O-methyltransferase Ste14